MLVELLNRDEIVFSETQIREDELLRADEIWVTSSGNELVPVVRLNNQTIGNGSDGPLFNRVLTIYREFKRNFGQSIE